jgi:hypothetical protein
MDKEIIWIVLVAVMILAIFAMTILLDTLDELRHQRKARQQFWKWVWYTRGRYGSF